MSLGTPNFAALSTGVPYTDATATVMIGSASPCTAK
jgi:hypothetical protein